MAAEPQSLPEFLEERGHDPQAIAVALYQFVEETLPYPLDEFKKQELAVEESKYMFYVLTGLYFNQGKKFVKSFLKAKAKGMKRAAEEEE